MPPRRAFERARRLTATRSHLRARPSASAWLSPSSISARRAQWAEHYNWRMRRGQAHSALVRVGAAGGVHARAEQQPAQQRAGKRYGGPHPQARVAAMRAERATAAGRLTASMEQSAPVHAKTVELGLIPKLAIYGEFTCLLLNVRYIFD